MKWLLPPLLGLSACAYTPPSSADVPQAVVEACQDQGRTEARRIGHAYGWAFLTWPITVPLEARGHTRRCLQGKGYDLG